MKLSSVFTHSVTRHARRLGAASLLACSAATGIVSVSADAWGGVRAVCAEGALDPVVFATSSTAEDVFWFTPDHCRMSVRDNANITAWHYASTSIPLDLSADTFVEVRARVIGADGANTQRPQVCMATYSYNDNGTLIGSSGSTCTSRQARPRRLCRGRSTCLPTEQSWRTSLRGRATTQAARRAPSRTSRPSSEGEPCPS